LPNYGGFLGRVINPDGVGKERKRFVRAIAISLRELMNQGESNAQSRDLAAFIALSLEAVAETIERTAAPWEKRDYWLKADRFRLEWDWAARNAASLRSALLADDWAKVAENLAQIGQKLSKEKLPKTHRLGEPWHGAWEKLQEG
jgi:hypothetical protein